MNRILGYKEAVNEAIIQLMEKDKRIYILGQGADDPTSAVGPLNGIKERFPNRIMDTPMAEEAVAGICIGMAMNGLRPINWHIRMDFLLLAMNQIINMASKISYMYGGQIKCPVVFRAMIGKSWGQGPQHSQSFYPFFMNIPGLNIYAPTIPYDAKGAFIKMMNKNIPSLFIEHRLLYYQKGEVPEDLCEIKEDSRILKQGHHITLVGVSQMAVECLRAAKILKQVGIEAEVISPISLKPFNILPISESVIKTGYLITVDNSWITGGLGSEIIAELHKRKHNFECERMGFAETVCPTSPSIEEKFYPNPITITKKVCELLGIEDLVSKFNFSYEREEIEFKGPF